MPVATDLIRVTRPRLQVGGLYTGISGDNAIIGSMETMTAYEYSGGSHLSTLGSVSLQDPRGGTTDQRYIVRTMNRIHSDSAGLVQDGSLAFVYRPQSSLTRWRICVWQVEGDNSIQEFELTSTTGISGAVYYDGWLWYFRVNFPELQLRRIRCDLSLDELVRSETIASNSPYLDDGNLSYMMLSSSEASCSRDSSPTDTPVFPLDGSPAIMTPGRSPIHLCNAGTPLPDGRSLGGMQLVGSTDPSPQVMSTLPGGLSNLWPSGWGTKLSNGSGGAFEGSFSYSSPSSGSTVSVYPVLHVDEPSGQFDSRLLVKTSINTVYEDNDTIPYSPVEYPDTGFPILAMIARS